MSSCVNTSVRQELDLVHHHPPPPFFPLVPPHVYCLRTKHFTAFCIVLFCFALYHLLYLYFVFTPLDIFCFHSTRCLWNELPPYVILPDTSEPSSLKRQIFHHQMNSIWESFAYSHFFFPCPRASRAGNAFSLWSFITWIKLAKFIQKTDYYQRMMQKSFEPPFLFLVTLW